jgi:hypothetical protein
MRYAASALFMILAMITSAAGVALVPVGLLYFALRRNWKWMTLYGLVSLITVGLYMWGHQPNPFHPTVGDALGSPVRTAQYASIYFANWLPVRASTATFLGGALLALSVAVTLPRLRENSFFAWLSLWSWVTVGVVALTRSGFGIEQAMESRYTPIALLHALSVGILCITRMKVPDLRRLGVTVLCAGAMLYWGWMMQHQIRVLLPELRATRIASITAFNTGDETRLLYPTPASAAVTLRAAMQSGIYDPARALR